MKVGHTRRNCDGEDCTFIMLCGVIEKHPNDKAERQKLSQQVTKCQTEVANLESDYNNKVKAYKAVEDSFARKIEADIVASDPERYIVNGVKNWVLLNKHVALLQKKCNGKLPPRQGITRLLREAVEEHEMKSTSRMAHNMEHCVNPKKRSLEEKYAIRFPRRSSPATGTLTAMEESDFRLAVRLQEELNSEDSSDVLAADFVSPGKDNPQSGMYVPGQGWKSPTFEPESCQRAQEAANALVELQKNNK